MVKSKIVNKIDIRKQYRRNQKFRFAVQVLGVVFGAVIAGLAFPTFFLPANIIPSGLSGIAQLISEWITGSSAYTAIVYLAINLVLFIVALKLFGWKFIVFTLIGLAAYTLSLQYLAIPGISNPEHVESVSLLYSLIGGGLMGFGQGIAFRVGGSTGGSDVAAKIINRFFPKIKTGVCVLIINFIVIMITVLARGWQTALYAVIVSVISTITCDMVLDGAKTVRAFYIISDKDQEISEAILKRFHRGVTVLPAKGKFSGKEEQMLLCLVANSQAREMKEIVKDIDKNAFMFSTAVNETLGEGYFMKEASITKNKIKSATNQIKTRNKYIALKKRPKASFGKKFKN